MRGARIEKFQKFFGSFFKKEHSFFSFEKGMGRAACSYPYDAFAGQPPHPTPRDVA
jgi:hypothetical protein